MRRGTGKAAEDRADLKLPPGTGYIITGEAQGRTHHCRAGRVAHQRCTCCWMHGVQTLPDGLVARQSVTIRVFAKWHAPRALPRSASKAKAAAEAVRFSTQAAAPGPPKS
mmetsp:Transcript_6590/g.19247  ORF Transcript_6590/g.19247 Transcript_6590/m.19247 type:complete len:110 (-) Transcript_6590:194-523(-)